MSLHGSSSRWISVRSAPDKFFEKFIANSAHKFAERQTYTAEWGSRIATFKLYGTLISASYKMVTVKIHVSPKANLRQGSYVAWTVEFDKISTDKPNPDNIIKAVVDYVQGD